MKANLVRTETIWGNKKKYIYACTKCGAEFSRMQCHDRINELCGKCKTEVDRKRNKELAEIRQAKHDAEVRDKAIDEVIRVLLKRNELGECEYEVIERVEQLKGGE